MAERKRGSAGGGAPSGAAVASIAAAAASAAPAPDLRMGLAEPSEGDGFDVADLGGNCPVQPLGFLQQRHFFLDWHSQLIELGTEFRKGECMALFGTKVRWLETKWPTGKLVKDKETGLEEYVITGFDQKEAQKGLIAACAKKGLFDPTGRVRGRGAHLADDGQLHLHCGDGVLIGGRKGARGADRPSAWAKPGLVGSFVYPAAPALDRPAEAAALTQIGEQVLALLGSWKWKRGAIDAHLLLCWVAAACLGGALKWRPHAWITGPSGAGKTSLQKFIEQLMGSWALRTEDATEAGVRQLLSQDTLAVCFDEIEPDENDGAVHHKIVKLARLASSGGSALRGGQDHKSKQFVARSCFLFSSIHHHELAAQDRNRITILHLAKFPMGTPPLILPGTLKDWGAALRRRLLEQWNRFDATLLIFQAEMQRQGYSGREQDQYGTLLACGDLLLHEAVPPENMQAALNGEEDRAAKLVRDLAQVLDSARAEAEDTTERCSGWLLSHRLPARGGDQQETVGDWLGKAAIEAWRGDSDAARRKLMSHGLKLIELAPDHDQGNGQGGLKEPLDPSKANRWHLAVANKNHRGVAEMFADSMWRGGVWSQALLGVEGAIGNKKARFGKGSPTVQCVIVPLTALVDLDGLIAEAQRTV